MGTQLYGSSINIYDPAFGSTTDDSQTAPQMAVIALGTDPGSMDSYPDFGFDFDGQVGRAVTATDVAMLPLEVQAGVMAEPAFTDVQATLASATETGDGGVSVAIQIQITGADGNAVGFTVASG